MGKLSEKQIEDGAKAAYEKHFSRYSWSLTTPDFIRKAWREDVEAAAPYVQYETTEPGAPLSDEEWNSIETGSEDFKAAINAVLAKRNVARPAPAEVDGDVVERMLKKFYYTNTTFDARHRNSMALAANDLLNVLRGPRTTEETSAWENRYDLVEWIINYRIEHRILKPKEKTPEEKVEAIFIDHGIRNTGTMVEEIVAALKGEANGD